MKDPHVVIVGAGPAGASLAYILSARGIRVTLLERRHDFAREFRGEVLMPSGVSALAQLGLQSRLQALPTHAIDIASVYLNRRLLFQQNLEDLLDDPIVAVSQPALLEMLVEEAERHSTFRFMRGVSLKDLMFEGDRATGVRLRENDVETELAADLVIGADGRNSAIRRLAGLPSREMSPPMDVVWCKLPLPDDWKGVRVYAGRGHLLIAYHTWDDSLQVGWVIMKGTFGELSSRGAEQWVTEMANHVSQDFAAHLLLHRDAVQRPFLLNVASDRAVRWSTPGTLLIGDAAHTMSPVGAQGINVALRDTIVAANHLVPVLSSGAIDPQRVAAAARAIEAERMLEIGRVQQLQALPPKLVLSRAWWGEPLRRLAAAMLSRPAMRGRAAGTMQLFSRGVTEVQLRV